MPEFIQSLTRVSMQRRETRETMIRVSYKQLGFQIVGLGSHGRYLSDGLCRVLLLQ